MQYVAFLVEHRMVSQAYLRSHINLAIYVLDFLKHSRARGAEVAKVEDLIAALSRLHLQVFVCVCGCVGVWVWLGVVGGGGGVGVGGGCLHYCSLSNLNASMDTHVHV